MIERTGPGQQSGRPQGRPPDPFVPGKTVRAHVVESSGQTLLLRLGGREYRAESTQPLIPGRSYRFIVETRSGVVVLRPLSGANAGSAPGLVGRLGLPPGPEASLVVRAFIRSSLPLDPAVLGRALERVRSGRAGRLDPATRARLAAVLEEKGLLASDEAWDALVDALGGDGGEEDAERGDEPSSRRRSAPDPPEGDAEAGPSPTPGTTDSLPPTIDAAEAFARVVRDALAGSETPHILQLANELGGRAGRWVVVPIRLAGDSAFRGSMRLWYPAGAVTPGSLRFGVVDLTADEERWTFGLIPEAGGFGVVALEWPEDSTTDFASLADRLTERTIGFRVAPLPRGANDGFSTVADPGILPAVDRLA